MINMFLTKKEEQMCDGEFGETVRKSMDILVALGDIYGASKLVDITSAQVSGVSYKTIGDAGLEYLQDLAGDDKGVASVNSSLNPPGTDLDNWEALGFPKEFSVKQNQIVEAYGKLGISKTCTCTPYLVGNVPRFRDHVSWSESSAVAYVNSVIGAKTNREGGPAALAAAIVGKTPLYGFHLDENRKANLVVDVETELAGADFGALGYIVGKIVGGGVPYFTLKNIPDNNNLKTLGAALASSGSVALYHMENVTPEYELAAKSEADDHITISEDDFLDTRNKLSTTADEPDLICLGCPHASLEEIKEVANIVRGKSIKNKLWICTSVSVKATADRMGYTKAIEDAGGNVVCDTCMVVAPIEDMGFEVIGVNSLKLTQESTTTSKYSVEGMGFAIPIEDALSYAGIIESGKSVSRPYLGVSMLDITDSYYLWQAGIKVPKNVTEGVAVLEVVSSSPAAKAGLQKNDIITKIEDEKISSVAKLRYELYKHNPGDTIKVTYNRDGKENTAEVTLEESK